MSQWKLIRRGSDRRVGADLMVDPMYAATDVAALIDTDVNQQLRTIGGVCRARAQRGRLGAPYEWRAQQCHRRFAPRPGVKPRPWNSTSVLDTTSKVVLGCHMRTSFHADDSDGDPDSESTLRHLSKGESADLDRARRGEKTQKILEDADDRDDAAAARDAVAEQRARVADREAFTDSGRSYSGHGERRAAAQDRADSKTDRESSAEDRARLAKGDA
ncbi:hypothetical protein GCM10009672_06220 [Nesterenkonia lutea]